MENALTKYVSEQKGCPNLPYVERVAQILLVPDQYRHRPHGPRIHPVRTCHASLDKS